MLFPVAELIKLVGNALKLSLFLRIADGGMCYSAAQTVSNNGCSAFTISVSWVILTIQPRKDVSIQQLGDDRADVGYLFI